MFFFTDALPVALQSAGEAAPTEMVHTNDWQREEEGDPGHDDDGFGPASANL